jgi:ABC-type glutathione transport system ATPase component
LIKLVRGFSFIGRLIVPVAWSNPFRGVVRAFSRTTGPISAFKKNTQLRDKRLYRFTKWRPVIMVHGGQIKEGDTILKLEDVHMSFGKVAALAGVNLEVKKGEIHSIIGPNGAGKTVMMNCINGLYKPQKGDDLPQRQNGLMI